MKSASVLAISLSVSALMSACGGGGGGGESDAGGGSSYANINALSITTPHGGLDTNGNPLVQADLSGGEFTVSWSSEWSSPSNLAAFELYLSEDATFDSSKELIYRNCGSLSFYSCNKTGSVDCSLGTNGVISCGSFDSLNVSQLMGVSGQTVNAIGRVCIYNASLAYVCNSRQVQVRINPVP